MLKSQSIILKANKEILDQENGSRKIKFKNPIINIEDRILGPLQPDSLRLKIIYAGICGTDVHLMQTNNDGFIKTTAPLDIPIKGRVIGHEGVGMVISSGTNINGFKSGDFVGLESIITCKKCESCRRGNYNQCLNAKLVGMQEDGIFATIVDVPESIAHNVTQISNNEEGLKSAACLEPAAVAWLSCNDTAITAGDDVLIFGGGPIGYFCAMIARLIFGAGNITLVEPVSFRRNHAKKWCNDTHEALNSEILNKSFDVIIEASGVLKNITSTVHCIKANGRVALLARSGEALTIDKIDHIITNNIKIIGVRGHLGGAIGRIINLCEKGLLPLHEAVTDIMTSLEMLEKTLNDSSNVVTNNCKVLVKIN